jgi:hypothetical protein
MKTKALIAATLLLSVGCGTLLPSKTTSTQTIWKSYQEVESVVEQIQPGHTLQDLRQLGLDVDTTPNIESLTYIDIAKRFGLIGLKDRTVTIPDGVKKLMEAAEKGKGYELNVKSTRSQRIGGFWADFFNFRKNTHTTGWEFTVLLIVVNDKVEYVLHKGNPNIDKLEKEKNPLGPFQKINGYILIDLTTDLAK